MTKEFKSNDSEKRRRRKTSSHYEISHFRMICETTPLVAIQGYDEEGNIFFWNKASEILYGYSAQEVHQKNIKEILLGPNDWYRFDVEVRKVIEEAIPTHPQQWKIRTRSGEVKHLLSTMVPVEDKGRNCVYCMDVDITEQVNLYEKLIEKENLYRIIVEGAHEGIWVVDENFVTVYVNPQIAKVLGYDPSYITGRTTLEFVPEEEHKDVITRRENRKKGIFEQYERTLICADGSRRTFLVNAAPLVDSENKFRGAIGFFTDITERKYLEKLIEKERNLLKEYLNLSPSIFLVLNREGNITFANEAVKRALHSVDRIEGMNFLSSFVSPQDRDIALKWFRDIIEGCGDTENLRQLCVVTLGQEERFFSLKCAGLKNDKGEIEGVICAGLDITEQKKAEKEKEILEERIKQTQRLESIGLLAGSIAHDFNNLLVGIVGNTDLAMMELHPEHPAQKYLEEVIKISKKMTHISNQLLAYSGKARTCVKEISLAELIKNMETLIELSVLSKKIALKFDLEENVPLISADPLYVQQVVIDLVANSAEAIGDKTGTISIVVRSMFCDRKYFENTYFGQDNPEGTYVYLEVVDTGPGIPEDVKHRMFEPFYTTKSFGRGLGLSAVAGIVKMHKGAIKVYTEPGKGTSIKVFFPALGEKKNVHESVVPKEADIHWSKDGAETKRALILVVDDEPMVRQTVKNMIELGGYEVITVEDGEKAIEVYKAYMDKISLVLLDMTMPVYDGEETFRELRRINPNVKVILSSGYSEQDIMDRFVGKGLAGFIQKPYVLSNLLETIRSVLRDEPMV